MNVVVRGKWLGVGMVSKKLSECFFCISLIVILIDIKYYQPKILINFISPNKCCFNCSIIPIIVLCPYIPHSGNWLLWIPAWECHSFFSSVLIWCPIQLPFASGSNFNFFVPKLQVSSLSSFSYHFLFQQLFLQLEIFKVMKIS